MCFLYSGKGGLKKKKDCPNSIIGSFSVPLYFLHTHTVGTAGEALLSGTLELHRLQLAKHFKRGRKANSHHLSDDKRSCYTGLVSRGFYILIF